LCRLLDWSVNNELQNIWKDGALFWFEFVSRNLSGVAEEKNGNRVVVVVGPLADN
jgi:hypothetical protein